MHVCICMLNLCGLTDYLVYLCKHVIMQVNAAIYIYIYTCTDILAPKMIVKFFGGCEINDLDPSARFELVYLGVVADYVSSILPLLKNTVQRFSVVLAEKGPS